MTVGGMPQYDDSQRSRCGSSDEKNRKIPGGLKGGGMPQCGVPLQISICWKWPKGTLRVSNDAPLRAHIDEELRNNGQ